MQINLRNQLNIKLNFSYIFILSPNLPILRQSITFSSSQHSFFIFSFPLSCFSVLRILLSHHPPCPHTSNSNSNPPAFPSTRQTSRPALPDHSFKPSHPPSSLITSTPRLRPTSRHPNCPHHPTLPNRHSPYNLILLVCPQTSPPTDN